jgi:predicted Ser/Thr protein kinase
VTDKDSISILADHVEKIACANCGHHLDVSSLPIFTLFNCPECHIQQMVPGKLGNFLLLEELGRGGMGVVYRGVDQALGRPVAIKVMHKSLGDDPQFLENFLREARAAAAINHRNVVQIFSFGREKGQPYLVMELVDGGRLDTYISSSQPLTELQALEICLEVAEGLKAAHEAGLMHGDIKPANILFDKKGLAKVADFGLASFIRQQKAGDRDIWGTPFYIAPEKARRLKSDQRADIYSLGATMFHALTIRPPFDGDTPTEVVLARLQLPPPDISTVRLDLHPETVHIINRMLMPDTLMRYPNYASLISDLTAAKAKIAAEPPGKVVARHAAAPASGGMLGRVLVIGGVVLVAAAAGTLYYVLNNKKPVEQPAVNVVAPVAPAPSVNPFNDTEGERIAEAVRPLARGAVLAVNNNLEALGLNVLTSPEQREWIRVFQAITLLADRREADAEEMLRVLPEPPAISTNIASEASRLPLTIAQYLLKKSDERSLAVSNTLTPGWYPPLTQFAAGLREWLSATNRNGAVARLQGYQPAAPNQPSWPFAFKGLAEHWIKQNQELDRTAGDARELAKAHKYAEARKLLEEFKAKCSPSLQGALSYYQRKLADEEGELRKKEDADKKRKADEDKKHKEAEVKQVPPKPEPKPEPVVPPAEIKAVFASSGTNTAHLASDGDFHTKWASLPRDNQWFIADLGANHQISGAVIYWDAAYPLDYKLQVSSDRLNWTEALKVRDSKGERAVHTFKPIEGRYLRVYSLIRSPKHLNIAINEIQVLVDGNKPPPAPAAPAP